MSENKPFEITVKAVTYVNRMVSAETFEEALEKLQGELNTAEFQQIGVVADEVEIDLEKTDENHPEYEIRKNFYHTIPFSSAKEAAANVRMLERLILEDYRFGMFLKTAFERKLMASVQESVGILRHYLELKAKHKSCFIEK